MTIAPDNQQFANILNALGAPAALAYLNAGVPHRYSAIYRLQDGMFENIYLHDKQGEVIPEFLAVVPFEVSFCQFVLRDTAFRTDDSGTDRRLDRHKYQGVVASYHGVPILDGTGELAGTLCHFDVMSYPLSAAEFELLEHAGRAFPARLLQRPDPRVVAKVSAL